MLVNLYKSKTPLAVFSFPLLVGVLALPVLFENGIILSGLFTWQNKFVALVLNSPVVHYVTLVATLYLSGIELNRLVNSYGFYSKNTYLPGVIYVLAIMSFHQAQFSVLLIAYAFLIYGLGFLFRINRQDSAKASIFLVAFFFGVATIFEPLLFPILLLPWFTLVVFRSFVWREWFMLLFGLSIPWAYHYGLYFFFTGEIQIATEGLAIVYESIQFSLNELSLIGFMVLLTIYSVWRYLIISNNQLLVFKKRSRLLFHFIWLTLISFGLGWWFQDIFIIAFIIPFVVVLSVQFLNGSVLSANLWITLWIALILWNVVTLV